MVVKICSAARQTNILFAGYHAATVHAGELPDGDPNVDGTNIEKSQLSRPEKLAAAGKNFPKWRLD